VTVRDGVEALDYLECCFAPRNDDLEVLDRLAASDHFRVLPVILLTGSQDESSCLRHHHREMRGCPQDRQRGGFGGRARRTGGEVATGHGANSRHSTRPVIRARNAPLPIRLRTEAPY
jgi:CheY-like chemotaxis protein